MCNTSGSTAEPGVHPRCQAPGRPNERVFGGNSCPERVDAGSGNARAAHTAMHNQSLPGKDLFASISAGRTALDGKPLSEGVERALFIVEGAEGTWDGRQLTLDLRWVGVGMSLSLKLSVG